MNNTGDLPWTKIHEFLLMAGDVRAPEEFCLNVAQKAKQLIAYDQARIYFLNDNRKTCDMVLYGGDRSWISAYLEYYSTIENGRYSVCNAQTNQTRAGVNVISFSYDKENPRFSREFMRDYIKPQGLRHSLSIFFHDEANRRKTVCTLDRTTDREYSQKEIKLAEVMQAHLDNLHKNLFVCRPVNIRSMRARDPKQLLTQREAEIVSLICDGITPINIAKQLCLSRSTVYRHIANIHEKLNVSNRQELILTMLKGQPGGL